MTPGLFPDGASGAEKRRRVTVGICIGPIRLPAELPRIRRKRLLQWRFRATVNSAVNMSENYPR